jgi:hypothetical protein
MLHIWEGARRTNEEPFLARLRRRNRGVDHSASRANPRDAVSRSLGDLRTVYPVNQELGGVTLRRRFHRSAGDDVLPGRELLLNSVLY